MLKKWSNILVELIYCEFDGLHFDIDVEGVVICLTFCISIKDGVFSHIDVFHSSYYVALKR